MKCSMVFVGLLCGLAPFASAGGEEVNKELARRYITEVWDQGNMQTVDQVIANNFVSLGPDSSDSLFGKAALKRHVERVRASYARLRCRVVDLEAKGNRVVLRWNATGTFTGNENLPGTNKKMDITGTSVFRIANGRIVQERASWDTLDWCRQVGIEPSLNDREDNVATVHRAIYELYNRGNLAVMDELFTPKYVGHQLGSGELFKGLAEAKEHVMKARRAFPDLYLVVDDMIVEGNKVVACWTARGTQRGEYQGVAPTNEEVTVKGLTMYRLHDGRIAESWTGWDRYGLLEQIGVKMASR